MAENQASGVGGKHVIHPLIRFLVEVGPLIAFFIANRLEGIFVGTMWLMGTTVIAIIISFAMERRVPLMPLISCAFVILFGGLTLVLDDEIFIKIKPTFVNLLFATVIFIGLFFRRTYLKLLMGSVLSLTDKGWWTLSLRWGVFFIVLAVLNEIVWRNFSTEFWVNFKVFGIMPISMAFGLAQMPLIMRENLDTTGGDKASSPSLSTGGPSTGASSTGAPSTGQATDRDGV